MPADLTEPFVLGWHDAASVFDQGNPYLFSSPSFDAFEAGRFGSNCWPLEDITGVTRSRGSSIRVHLVDGKSVVLRVDYDDRTVTR